MPFFFFLLSLSKKAEKKAYSWDIIAINRKLVRNHYALSFDWFDLCYRLSNLDINWKLFIWLQYEIFVACWEKRSHGFSTNFEAAAIRPLGDGTISLIGWLADQELPRLPIEVKYLFSYYFQLDKIFNLKRTQHCLL